jgi:hypothetical protein
MLLLALGGSLLSKRFTAYASLGFEAGERRSVRCPRLALCALNPILNASQPLRRRSVART